MTDVEMLNDVYKEISDLIGISDMLKIYSYFKGQQVSFPIRLYNPQLVKESVIKEYTGINIKALSQKYNYSERTIRRMIKEANNK